MTSAGHGLGVAVSFSAPSWDPGKVWVGACLSLSWPQGLREERASLVLSEQIL